MCKLKHRGKLAKLHCANLHGYITIKFINWECLIHNFHENRWNIDIIIFLFLLSRFKVSLLNSARSVINFFTSGDVRLGLNLNLLIFGGFRNASYNFFFKKYLFFFYKFSSWNFTVYPGALGHMRCRALIHYKIYFNPFKI